MSLMQLFFFVLKGFLAIGIASVARPSGTSYLLQTTQSLLNNTSERDKNNIQIVIFLADLHETPKSTMREELSRTFGKYIKQGLLTVIETYPEYYPELNNIKEKFHDSASRRMWRSKENVDNAFVMCYCKDFSRYYIHLEDDVKSSPSFLPKLEDLINEQPSTHWPMLDVAVKGSIAKMFQSHDLENAAAFFYLMYDEMPLDWLMDHWRRIKDKESYNKPLASLFEHTGVKSTLAEKGPHGSDALEPFFDAYDHKYKGHNPPATVTSSISSFQGKPQDAYNKGGGYFWAGSSQKDDYILITFHKPTSVQKVFVDTGSHSASSDLLHFGILQASFESTEEGEMSDGANSCGNFHTIGSFDDGRAEIPCDESKKLTCLQIVLTQNHEPIFLREIDVWESLSSSMTGV